MIFNILTSTVLSLKAHKLRVILTMIGIIIGISSVVTITSLGEGLKQSELDMIDDSGINTIKIIYEEPEMAGLGYYSWTPFTFDRIDMKRLRSVPDVAAVTADYGYGGFTAGEQIDSKLKLFGIESSAQIVAATEDTSPVSYGRNFTTEDMDKPVIILDDNAASGLANDMEKSELIGKAVSLDGYMYKIVGIKESVDWDSMMNVDEDLFLSTVPKKAFLALSKSKPINAIKITPKQGADRDTVISAVAETLASYHADLDGSFVEDHYMDDMRQQMEQVYNIAIWIFIGITGISLLVGGIGVMNIMYVSVSERRREIGIKRAIGAKPKVILLQFLFEAAFITLLGGIIGIAFGYGISHLFSFILQTMNMGDFTAILRPAMAAIAAGVSVAIGLFFGIVPAIGASKTDPIKAIYQ
ncbi:MAG: ABC transporter permease [Clostridiales Family XIII bacterium]|jgi:putative ABC transport system permease protein|nr:ABC transporter permease [Clostridiales Family XIII bacterium]